VENKFPEGEETAERFVPMTGEWIDIGVIDWISLTKDGEASSSDVIRILLLIPAEIESHRTGRRDSRYREMQFRMARTYKA